jgi:hypothetical protein
MKTEAGPGGIARQKGKHMDNVQRGIYWRTIRNRLEWHLALIDHDTIEWRNIKRRVDWINRNRL